MSKRTSPESSTQDDNPNLSGFGSSSGLSDQITISPDIQDSLNKDPPSKTNTQPTTERRALRPKYQPIDTITIETIPRLKESDTSGDEWRYHAQLQFKSKGKVIYEKSYGDVEEATKFVCAEYAKLRSFSKVNLFPNQESEMGDICDQEGCLVRATKTFKLKYRFTRRGKKKDPYGPRAGGLFSPDTRPLVRKFCNLHSYRGDCALEDSDDNYERIEDPTLQTDPSDLTITLEENKGNLVQKVKDQ